MRVLMGFLGLLVAVALTPPTSVEFHARYGKPDAERFDVRSDAMLSVEYGEDGEVCAMRIEPRHDGVRPSSKDPPASMETITRVLDEVVPPGERGKELASGTLFADTDMCRGNLAAREFENLLITTYHGACGTPLTFHGFDVHFKRPACEQFLPRPVSKPQTK